MHQVKVTEHMRPGDAYQEINVRESEVVCSASVDSCFGRLTVTQVNYTVEGKDAQAQGYQVSGGGNREPV